MKMKAARPRTSAKMKATKPAFAISMGMIIALGIALARRTEHAATVPKPAASVTKPALSATAAGRHNRPATTARAAVTYTPKDEPGTHLRRNKLLVAGTEVEYLWQLPHETEGGTTAGTPSPPRGLLFLAHGCSHSMTDWWARTESTCPECIGLPEEVAIVDTARGMGLAVIAISSSNRLSKCWREEDGPIVARVLLAVREDVGAGSAAADRRVSLFAFGASSGGRFVSMTLPRAVMEEEGTGGSSSSRLDGVISEIMGFAYRPDYATPAAFLTMERDSRTREIVESEVRAQNEDGVAPAVQLDLPRREITSAFFAERVPGSYDRDKSADMATALAEGGFLAEDGTLIEDPRESRWRDVLRPFAASDDGLVADKSPLSEVMNVAYAKHEMARDEVKTALEFLFDSTLSS